MPRRPGPRSWLARQLRVAADAVERADPAPTAGGPPAAPDLPPAEPTREVPRRPGQPPEHWLRLVAAHAPGLLHGLDLDPDALPDAQPPAGPHDPRHGLADGVRRNPPPTGSGAPPATGPGASPATGPVRSRPAGSWPGDSDAITGSWPGDSDAPLGEWRGGPDGGGWRGHHGGGARPGGPAAALTRHGDRAGALDSSTVRPDGTAGSWAAGRPGEQGTGVGHRPGDPGVDSGDGDSTVAAGGRAATASSRPDGVNRTATPSSPVDGTLPGPGPAGWWGAAAPDARPAASRGSAGSSAHTAASPASSGPGGSTHHRSGPAGRHGAQPADADPSASHDSTASPGSDGLIGCSCCRSHDNNCTRSRWPIRPAGSGDTSCSGPGDGNADRHRDALPAAGRGGPRLDAVDRPTIGLLPATASFAGTTADGRAGTGIDPYRTDATGRDGVVALRFPAPWSAPTGARRADRTPADVAGARTRGFGPDGAAAAVEHDGQLSPDIGFDSRSWSADRRSAARPGRGRPDAGPPAPAPDPWPVLPDEPAGGAVGVPPTGATTAGRAGRWAADPWPALPDGPAWRPAPDAHDGERLRRLDHEQRGA